MGCYKCDEHTILAYWCYMVLLSYGMLFFSVYGTNKKILIACQYYLTKNYMHTELNEQCCGVSSLIVVLSLTLSAHAREGYSSHFVCLSVFFFIVEKAPFSGLKLTSVHSR